MARISSQAIPRSKVQIPLNKENRKERKDRLLSYKANPLGVEQHGDNPCASPYGPRHIKIELGRTQRNKQALCSLIKRLYMHLSASVCVCLAMAHPCMARPLL